MYRLARALLFLLPPEAAHGLGMAVARFLGVLVTLVPALGRALAARAHRPGLESVICGLRFPTPIGLAAGLDKDARAAAGFFALGFGAVEVGTVTPRPQPGNPRPRVFRLRAHRALINRMGFNNDGAAAAARRLARLGFRPAPLGVNLGKNKDTPLDEAGADYLAGLELLEGAADYVVINASSPNTPGLRALQEPERLRALLDAVRARTAKPLFLKIAPDLSDDGIDAAVDVAVAARADGLVCTNTTLARDAVAGAPHAAETGGLSGAPLAARSTEVVRRAYRRAAGRLAIVGVGGVFTPEDVYEKIRAGAQLVQVYTGFVYEGPGLALRLANGLAVLLARDGLTLGSAVGKDA
jgi:dihydroorotate dehydrogenase